MHVADASALLAFLQRESGSDIVERVLSAGETVVGAANWSEIAQKLLAHGRNWDFARGLVISYGITIKLLPQKMPKWLPNYGKGERHFRWPTGYAQP